MMLKKIGFDSNDILLYTLVDELLLIMKNLKLDYTNTFNLLCQDNLDVNKISSKTNFIQWYKKWTTNILKKKTLKEAKELMKKHNPIFIARNHLVEEAIAKAVNGNIEPYNKLLEILSSPYQHRNGLEKFLKPPIQKYEESFRTYCGT